MFTTKDTDDDEFDQELIMEKETEHCCLETFKSDEEEKDD